MDKSTNDFLNSHNARLQRSKIHKDYIENFKEKADFLESCGWEARFNVNNWTKKGHQDSNGYWKEYPEHTMDEAYDICKASLTLTVKERDIVIELLKEGENSGFLSEKELELFKKLKK